MAKKMTLGGVGLLLFLALFWFYEAKVPPAAEPAPPRPGIPKTLRATGLAARVPAPGRRTLPPARAAFAEDASGRNLVTRLNAFTGPDETLDWDQFSALLRELVQSDPAAAARFARSLAPGRRRGEALRRVAQFWTTHDPAGAEDWAARLPDASERGSVLTAVCFELARTDAAQAVEKARQYQLEKAPGDIVANLAQQWADQNFPEAADWVDAQPAGEQRDRMFMRLAIVRAHTSPAEAARMVVERIAPGPDQTEAIVSVVSQWAMRDRAGAQSWVAVFPAGALRDRAEHELAITARFQK